MRSGNHTARQGGGAEHRPYRQPDRLLRLLRSGDVAEGQQEGGDAHEIKHRQVERPPKQDRQHQAENAAEGKPRIRPQALRSEKAGELGQHAAKPRRDPLRLGCRLKSHRKHK